MSVELVGNIDQKHCYIFYNGRNIAFDHFPDSSHWQFIKDSLTNNLLNDEVEKK